MNINKFNEKARNRWYLAGTITNADYADDIALLANTPTQAEFLLDSLKRAAGGIGLHVNIDKTEYMSFNQSSDILPLKLVDNFPHPGSCVINRK